MHHVLAKLGLMGFSLGGRSSGGLRGGRGPRSAREWRDVLSR